MNDIPIICPECHSDVKVQKSDGELIILRHGIFSKRCEGSGQKVLRLPDFSLLLLD